MIDAAVTIFTVLAIFFVALIVGLEAISESRLTNSSPSPAKPYVHVAQGEPARAPADAVLIIADLEARINSHGVRIVQLRDENLQLRERYETALAERDAMRRRAEIAESNRRSPEGKPDRRYTALKRLLARSLHPDHIQHEGIERLVRAEIFKELWPKIEKLDNTTTDEGAATESGGT